MQQVSFIVEICLETSLFFSQVSSLNPSQDMYPKSGKITASSITLGHMGFIFMCLLQESVKRLKMLFIFCTGFDDWDAKKRQGQWSDGLVSRTFEIAIPIPISPGVIEKSLLNVG